MNYFAPFNVLRFLILNRLGNKKAVIAVSEDNIAMVMSMGFSLEQAKLALQNTDNNVERAIEWIFSHPEGAPEPAPTAAAGQSQESGAGVTDGAPR